MVEAVGNGFARPAGGRRRFAQSLCIALGALAAACPTAAAQLPELTGPVKLPVDDGALGGAVPDGPVKDVVTDVANQDLPDPVEQVVEDSPVAPVREEVRRIVNQSTGGSSGGGNGGGSSGTSSGSGAGTHDGGSGGSRRSDSPRSNRGGGDRSSRGSIRRAARSAAGTRGARRSRNAARTRPGQEKTRAGDEGGGAAARTIETIVHAVPTPIWIALGVLSLLALALSVRTFVAGRRTRSLARDRERLLHDVESLERALLPAVPEQIGGLCTSVAYRSSDGPAAGGDFYDAFELPDGRVAVLIGDVSGHGAEALESTNSLRSQLHGLLEAGISPRAAIAMVGERAPVQLAGRFTTVVVAVHDSAAGTLTYAGAGHPPPIIVGPGADDLLSTGASPPIGVGLRTGVRETTVALPADAVVCLYTDGVVEARAGGAMLGRARLEAMVGELGADDAALELLERVVAEADEASDDLTVCLLRPVAGSASAPSLRVEMLEIDSDDLDSGFARRFLAACGVPARRVAVAIDQARATVRSQGLALLEVTVADGGAAVTVAAPEAPAPASAV